MVYFLILSIVAVVVASIFAIRPTAHERLTAHIRNQAVIKGWKVRFASEEDLKNMYNYPLKEQVLCYFKYNDETIRQADCESWGIYNDTIDGTLTNKYLNLYQDDGDLDDGDLEKEKTLASLSSRLKTIDMLFQNYGDIIYGIEFNQSGVFVYWNEKIQKTEAINFLAFLSRLLD